MLKTAATIRTGVPQHKHDFYGMAEDEMVFFFEGLHRRAVTAGEELARMCNLSRYKHLLDVGTGSGGLAMGAARVCPEPPSRPSTPRASYPSHAGSWTKHLRLIASLRSQSTC